MNKLVTVGIITLALIPNAFADPASENVELPPAAQVASLQALVQELIEQQRCHGDAGIDNRFVEGGGVDGADWVGGVDWSGCDKRGIRLLGSTVTGADWWDNNLINADLRFTDFTMAIIIGVWMGGANLEGANFTDANLVFSGLQNANVIGPEGVLYGKVPTIFDNTICPDGTNSDANGGTCIGHLAGREK